MSTFDFTPIPTLVQKYNYKPLPKDLSAVQRFYYLVNLPSYFRVEGDLNCDLYDRQYHLVAHGYSRVVIGDYGAYIEIPLEKMVLENLIVKPGQEYRFEPRYSNVKYHWYCLKENQDIKIYYQKHPVKYADYKPEMFYIAPDDLVIMGVDLNEEELLAYV